MVGILTGRVQLVAQVAVFGTRVQSILVVSRLSTDVDLRAAVWDGILTRLGRFDLFDTSRITCKNHSINEYSYPPLS